MRILTRNPKEPKIKTIKIFYKQKEVTGKFQSNSSFLKFFICHKNFNFSSLVSFRMFQLVLDVDVVWLVRSSSFSLQAERSRPTKWSKLRKKLLRSRWTLRWSMSCRQKVTSILRRFSRKTSAAFLFDFFVNFNFIKK